MFLEAGALLPQINIIRKAGFVEVNVGRYIVMMALSRLFRLAFWIMMYIEGD
jgi:membrane protein YqaA with SNARE-associated domain